MRENSNGILISCLKYGDTSAILKIFTPQHGLLSFMKKGAFSRQSKRKFQFFPLSECEISFRLKPEVNLHSLYNLEYLKIISATTDVKKGTVLLFLSEVLHSALDNQEHNKSVYAFIRAEVDDLEENPSVDFHLNFLAKLTRFLGFFPQLENRELPFFDIISGTYVYGSNVSTLSEDISLLWKQLFSNAEVQFEREQKKKLIGALLEYYASHLEGFRQPKSLAVLEAVYS